MRDKPDRQRLGAFVPPGQPHRTGRIYMRIIPLTGSMPGMAKEKATITVDRAKLSEARAVLGVSSASAAIDIALSELLRRRRVLHDVEAYLRTPPTGEEGAPSHVLPDWSDLADDTDWDAEWPEDR